MAPGAIKRDRWDRPQVPSLHDPSKLVTYLRPSNLGDYISDKGALQTYTDRRIVWGMGRMIGLADEVLECTNFDDPRLDDILYRALRLTHEDTGAEFGTGVHAAMEGKRGDDITPEMIACAEAILAALKRDGWSLVPELQEITVINDVIGAVGTMDGAVVHIETGEIRAFDIKTSKEVRLDPPGFKTRKWSIQLGTYGNANNLFDHPNRLPLPPEFDRMSKYLALVAYVDRSTAEVALIDVDIARGFIAAKAAARVYWERLTWQWVKDLAVVRMRSTDPMPEEAQAVLEQQLAESLDQAAGCGWRHDAGEAAGGPWTCPVCGATNETATDSPEPLEAPPAFPEWLVRLEAVKAAVHAQTMEGWRAQLARRIDILRPISGAIEHLLRVWPNGVSTLKEAPEHTAEQLRLIETAIYRAEGAAKIPFPEADPFEGGAMDPDAFVTLRARLARHKVEYEALAQEAAAVGSTLWMGRSTLRRFNVGRLALRILEHQDGERLRPIIEDILPPAPAETPLGALLGALTHSEADLAYVRLVEATEQEDSCLCRPGVREGMT